MCRMRGISWEGKLVARLTRCLPPETLSAKIWSRQSKSAPLFSVVNGRRGRRQVLDMKMSIEAHAITRGGLVNIPIYCRWQKPRRPVFYRNLVVGHEVNASPRAKRSKIERLTVIGNLHD